MLFEDAFKTISGRSEGIHKDKGSRFISIALPVGSEEEARKQLANLKNEFHDARHHCYAYLLGPASIVFRFSDDGEPAGTAGRIIYGQIQSSGLTNILVVVVRYFGGVKLGVRGLINAYRNAAYDALNTARVIEKTVKSIYEVRFDYSLMEKVMRLAKEENLSITQQDFDLLCILKFSVRRILSNRVVQKFKEIKGLEINYIQDISE
jgi:uncharacterized YigZ family protein